MEEVERRRRRRSLGGGGLGLVVQIDSLYYFLGLLLGLGRSQRRGEFQKGGGRVGGRCGA